MLQMYVNESYNIEDQTNSCYLHPDEKFVGVCYLCLNERLINLAYLSKNSHACLRTRSFNFCSGNRRSFFSCGNVGKKPVLQKSFSLGSDIFHHLEFKQHKSDNFSATDIDDSVSTSSQEESYISIKIDEETFASWEKSNSKQISIKPVDDIDIKKAPEVNHVKHTIQENIKISEVKSPTPILKPQTANRLSWHSCIGQLIKKKGSMRGWVCHTNIDKVAEGAKVRKSWIQRTFAKRREPKKE